jgi:flagellar biosynthesis/type III secretory pathway M-ring protein FliF/YscJ
MATKTAQFSQPITEQNSHSVPLWWLGLVIVVAVGWFILWRKYFKKKRLPPPKPLPTMKEPTRPSMFDRIIDKCEKFIDIIFGDAENNPWRRGWRE